MHRDVYLPTCPARFIPTEKRNLTTTKSVRFMPNMNMNPDPKSNTIVTGLACVYPSTILALIAYDAIKYKKENNLATAVSFLAFILSAIIISAYLEKDNNTKKQACTYKLD